MVGCGYKIFLGNVSQLNFLCVFLFWIYVLYVSYRFANFPFRAAPISAAATPNKPLSDMKFAIIGRLQQSKVMRILFNF